jgi:hypothetical protein
VFATVRSYAITTEETVDSLADQAQEIRAVLSSVPGTEGGLVIRSRDGVIVVALGTDERSVMESSRRFVAWSMRHVVAFRDIPAPEVWSGEVLVETTASHSVRSCPPAGGRR